MIMPHAIEELSIVGVYDRGVPNKERIVICANESVATGQFGLMLGIRAEDGTAIPVRDNLLWFGNAWLNKGDWVFVYTGPGEARVTDVPNNTERLYSIHWGKKKVALQSMEIVPILFRMDAVIVPADTPALPSPSTQGV